MMGRQLRRLRQPTGSNGSRLLLTGTGRTSAHCSAPFLPSGPCTGQLRKDILGHPGLRRPGEGWRRNRSAALHRPTGKRRRLLPWAQGTSKTACWGSSPCSRCAGLQGPSRMGTVGLHEASPPPPGRHQSPQTSARLPAAVVRRDREPSDARERARRRLRHPPRPADVVSPPPRRTPLSRAAWPGASGRGRAASRPPAPAGRAGAAPGAPDAPSAPRPLPAPPAPPRRSPRRRSPPPRGRRSSPCPRPRPRPRPPSPLEFSLSVWRRRLSSNSNPGELKA